MDKLFLGNKLAHYARKFMWLRLRQSMAVAVPNAFGAHPTPVPVGLPSGGVPTGKGCGYL